MSEIQKCPNLVRGGGSTFFKNVLNLEMPQRSEGCFIRGGVKIENRENLDKFPIRVDPPPPDLWDIFEFGTFLKNVDPPLLTKLGHF